MTKYVHAVFFHEGTRFSIYLLVPTIMRALASRTVNIDIVSHGMDMDTQFSGDSRVVLAVEYFIDRTSTFGIQNRPELDSAMCVHVRRSMYLSPKPKPAGVSSATPASGPLKSSTRGRW